MKKSNDHLDKHQENLELFKKALEEGLSNRFDQIANSVFFENDNQADDSSRDI